MSQKENFILISSSLQYLIDMTKTERRIMQSLLDAEKKKRVGIFKHGIFFSQRTIAAYNNCCIKTVYRYNKKYRDKIFTQKFRKISLTQEYFFDKELFDSFRYAERLGVFSKTTKELKLLLEQEKEKEKAFFHREFLKMSDPPTAKCPTIKTLITEHEGTGYINPQIQKIKISLEDKIKLSKYPEFAVSKAIEDAIWYQAHRGKIESPVGFMINRMRDHCRKRQSLKC